MRSLHPLLTAAIAAALLATNPVLATEFTYRGQLEDGGLPAQGRYDLRLTPYSDAQAGLSITAPIELRDVSVVQGRFAAALPPNLLPDTIERVWLQVEVRDAGGGGWSRLPDRQPAILKGTTCPAGWELEGNSGTSPDLNFIGTTDDQPLELRVRNGRALRLEPSSNFWNGLPLTINTLGGSHGNQTTAGVRGATIAGGGAAPSATDPDFAGVARNRITDHYGVVAGGFNNRAGDDGGTLVDAANASVGGGRDNIASGRHSTVAGGSGNLASANEASVLGGLTNSAIGARSIAGGGWNNLADGSHSAVLGGIDNAASGSSAFLGGGSSGVASGAASVIAGGQTNTASGTRAAVLGGVNNSAIGDNSSINGGSGNCAGGTNSWAGGNRAKIRPGSNAGEPGLGCVGVGDTGTTTGDAGTFVWADNQNLDYVSAGPNRFLVRASGGVVFTADAINNPQDNLLRVNGTLRLDTLGSAGGSTLCRNAINQIASCSSSARYKSDIVDLQLGLDAVRRLRAVGYTWTDSGVADIGFVAEEVAAIDSRLVTLNDDGEIEGVKYERLSALLANAVRELTQSQQVQAEVLAALQHDNTELRAELAAMRRTQGRILAALDALPSPPSAEGVVSLANGKQ